MDRISDLDRNRATKEKVNLPEGRCFVCTLFVYVLGDAIKCFECNSYNDTRCSLDKPPPELERDCTLKDTEKIKHTMCRKITQTIEFEVNGREFSVPY